jgi:hypothetical protein
LLELSLSLPESASNPISSTSLPRAVLWTISTLAIFLIVEATLFRLPWYYQYLQPSSSTGQVELNLYWLRHFRPANVREVLAIGDSRMAEGFSPWVATVLSGDQRLYFWNASVGGTTPRVWYYQLRDIDPHRDRFHAIVIGLDHYSDEAEYDSMPNRILDLNYAVGRLRIGDIWTFSSSLRTREYQQVALVGAAFKGTVLRSDIHEFLEDVPKRVKLTKDARQSGLIYSRNYDGRKEDLHGLSVNWQTGKITFPPGLDADTMSILAGRLMPILPPQVGELTRYRKRWLGRILNEYRNSSTRILFIEMPRGPLQMGSRKVPAAFLDEARQQTNVTVLDAAAFHELETPETFFDALHLNGHGRDLFSVRLGELVRQVLMQH